MDITQTVEDRINEAKDNLQDNGQSLFDLVRKTMLAGLGLAVLTTEEITTTINRLVEKGQIAEKDGRRLLNEMVEKRRRQPVLPERTMDSRLDDAVEKILNKMNIPSKSDIENLTRRVIALSTKIDELTEQTRENDKADTKSAHKVEANHKAETRKEVVGAKS